MKALKITVVILAVITTLLAVKVRRLNDQLKETEIALTEAQASYERCVDKNERFQSLYQTMVNENSHLLRKIREYEPNFGITIHTR